MKNKDQKPKQLQSATDSKVELNAATNGTHQGIRPDPVTEIEIEDEYVEEPRSLAEILKAEEEFADRIWYGRRLYVQDRIKAGLEKAPPLKQKKAILAAMKRVETKYGGKKAMHSHCQNEFDWAMMNGKLSALRWVTGSEWDFLDT